MLYSRALGGVASLVLVSSVAGCSGDDSDGSEPDAMSGPGPGGATALGGQVTEPWSAYCVATFTMDYPYVGLFGDVEFTARTGERYLMTQYREAFGEDHAELVYLTPTGPREFEVNVELGSRAFPFTSNCAFDDTLPYEAVFVDVEVFSDEALSMPLCQLTAGTVLPSDGTQNSGHAAVRTGSGSATYQVFLNSLGAECEGATEGYISVSETEIFGIQTYLIPTTRIIGPK